MQSYLQATRETRLSYLALFVAVAAALSLLERSLPLPVPWARIGLANLVTLLLVAAGCYRDALLVGVLRSFLTALLAGGLFSPGHLLSLAGVLAAVAGMSLLHARRGRWFSVYGISLSGAWLHGLAQLLVARVLFLSWTALVALAPLVLGLSLVSGILVAALASRFLGHPDEPLVPQGGM